MSRRKRHNQEVSPIGNEAVSGGVTPRKFPLKLVLIVVGAVAVLGLVAFVSTKLISNNRQAAVCNDEVLTKAAQSLKDNNSKELETLSNEIIAKSGYEQDVNCLYIVTNASIDAGNVEQSRTYLAKLKTAYNPDEGYNPLLGDKAPSPDQLTEVINFLETSAQQPTEVFYIGGQQP